MSSAPEHSGRHILVVEDERIVALHTRMVLEDAGYRVSSVHDGASACTVAGQDRSVDLILMDIDLGPQSIDGTDAASCILAGRELPIVFHTSHDEQQMVARVKGITRYGYVLKNSGPFVLLEAITTAFELFAAHERLRERNEFIQTVLDNLPIGLAVNFIDQGTATYMNREFERVYGWPASMIADIPEFFERVYPDPEYREQVASRIMSDIASGDPRRMVWDGIRITREDGSTGLVQARNIPIPNQNFMISTAMDTTAQSAVRAELENKRRQLQDIAAAAPGVLYQLRMGDDGTLSYPYIGPGIDELTGYSAAEISADPGILVGTIPEDERPAVMSAVRQSAQDLSLYDVTHRSVSRDGDVRWLHFRAMPRSVEGAIVWTGIAFDVTEQLRLTQEFRRSEEAFHRMFMQADFGLAETDLHGTILRANPALHRMLGYPEGALVGVSTVEITHPGDREAELTRTRELLGQPRTPFTFFYRKRYLHRDGSTVDADLRGYVMRDADGQPSTVFGLVMDLTQQLRLSDQAAESQALFEGAFHASPLLAAVSRLEDLRFVAVNDSFLNAIGWSREEVVGRTAEEIGLVTHAELNRLFGLRSQGRFIRGERSAFRSRDGREFPVRLFARVIELQDKPHMVALAQDTSEEEDRAQALERALRQSRDLMDELVHRVRNNLQIMAALISLKDRTLGPGVDLSDLHAQVQAIQSVHNALSTTEEGQPVDVGAWLSSLLPQVFGALNAGDVHITVDAPVQRVPARDALAIGLIVNELATNAAKHGFAPESERPEFTVSLHRAGEEMVLSVENNGRPMSGVPDPGESHLGLALVAAQADQLGGSMSIETDRHTRFVIRFPQPHGL